MRKVERLGRKCLESVYFQLGRVLARGGEEMKQGKGFKPLRAKIREKSGARPRTLPRVVVGVGALWFIPTPAHTRVSGVAAL